MDIVERLRICAKYDPDQAEAADEIERLRQQSRQFWDAFQKAANEVIRLTENAKQDAQFLMAYHHICQKHGIAPSSSDLIEAMQEIAIAKATGGE